MNSKGYGAPASRSGSAAAAACALAALLLLGACAKNGDDPRYAAEKKLFRARKLREEVVAGGMKPEFLAKAVDAYRSVVQEYEGPSAGKPGLAEIVVTAQMELAELEFRGGLLRESRKDFEQAIDIAGSIPAARVNALYSAAVISEELGEGEHAVSLYERLYRDFLPLDSLSGTARLNPRYLVTPLKLADIMLRAGRAEDALRWHREAERIYRHLIAHETDPALLKETRFNLLTSLLQQKSWSAGLALARELQGLYPEARDVSSALFIEAKIYESGLGQPQQARSTYLSIAERFPREQEAAAALLAAAGIDRRAGRTGEARVLYERVIDSFDDRPSEVVESHWQLAAIDEAAGRWEEASLRYKSIYTRYPETLQGFEAPLCVALNYERKGEADAAKAAYDRAIEHYEGLASGRRQQGVRIMAEQYLVRTLTQRKQWREAAERLLALPDRYPEYTPFRENYLKAAAIYERELADKRSAVRALEAGAAKYPGTELARAAEKELARLAR